MALKKSSKAGLQLWTVAQLSAFYTENRQELLAHANRVLKDSSKAEEVTQDALIKFMLAAPELESADHALSYLHRTIENLCIDLFRAEGRRPNLVVLDDATAEVEASWQADGDHSAALSAAEDAAVIRQALSLLSPAERAALVMWEVEGRSTEEIAAELGIKESAVRHTVSRARLSLRRILTEVVLDQERGLTAMDMLSSTYKKASEVAQKSARATLSLLLVITAFLGFNSLTGNEGVVPTLPNQVVEAPSSTTEVEGNAPVAIPTDEATIRAQIADFNAGLAVVTSGLAYVRTATSNIGWYGLDSEGVPSGLSSNLGAYSAPNRQSVGLTKIDANEYVFQVEQDGVLVFINQDLSLVDGKVAVEVSSLYLAGNSVYTPVVTDQSVVETRLSDGNRLVNVWVTIDPSEFDQALPSQINVKIKVSADGSEILAESSQLLFTSPTIKTATS